MTTKPRKPEPQAHRQHTVARDVVRIEVEASSNDTALIQSVAEALRGETERAQSLRSVLQEVLIAPEITTAFDVFGSDLPDHAFADVFDQPRDSDWRKTGL